MGQKPEIVKKDDFCKFDLASYQGKHMEPQGVWINGCNTCYRVFFGYCVLRFLREKL